MLHSHKNCWLSCRCWRILITQQCWPFWLKHKLIFCIISDICLQARASVSGAPAQSLAYAEIISQSLVRWWHTQFAMRHPCLEFVPCKQDSRFLGLTVHSCSIAQLLETKYLESILYYYQLVFTFCFRTVSLLSICTCIFLWRVDWGSDNSDCD